MKHTIPPEVMNVLRRSTVAADRVVLPDEQLPRPLYEAVNKVLANAGGKWNRSAKAHLFTSDPRPKLGLAIETGVSVNEKKAFQAFYTPPALAARVVELAAISAVSRSIAKVLEPSVGEGALLREILAQNPGSVFVHAIDVNPEAVAKCRTEFAGAVGCFVDFYVRDFLDSIPEPKFDRVVMNPPFTRGTDVRHVAHAYRFLRPGGTLVAIMAPGSATTPLFRKLITAAHADAQLIAVHPVEAGTFKESGTDIATSIVILKRAGCPEDTNGDGDCHKCAGLATGCPEKGRP